MKKRFLFLVFAFIFSIALTTPAFASAVTTEKNLPVLVESSIQTFNGVKTRIDYYTQNGAQITAYTILDKTLSQTDMNKTIDTIKFEKASSESDSRNAASNPVAMWTKDFYDEDPNPTTVRAGVAHHGTFCKSNIDLAYLWAEDVQTEIEFSDPEITPEIYVQRTFKATGLSASVSISWPLSLGGSVGVATDTYTCAPIGPISANFLTVDWPNSYSASNLAGTAFSLEIISDVAFYARDEARTYSGYVSTTQSFQSGW